MTHLFKATMGDSREESISFARSTLILSYLGEAGMTKKKSNLLEVCLCLNETV